MRALLVFALCVFIAILALGLMSCGGGGSVHSAGNGSLMLLVKWPSTRDIPPTTRSIRVTATTLLTSDAGLKTEDKAVGDKLVTRPEGQATSTISLDQLPSVDVRIKVFAYASTDGTGEALAGGSKDTRVSPGQTSNVTITLQGPQGGIVIDPPTRTVGMCIDSSYFETLGPSLNDKRVTWSLSGGGAITATDMDSSGVSMVSIEPGLTAGTYTVKATSVADPSISGTATMIVDVADDSSWNGAAFIVQPPLPDGKYVVTNRDRNQEWLMTRTGDSFSGSQITGGEGSLTFSISGNVMTGSQTIVSGGTTLVTPFSYNRDIFCEHQ